MKKISLKKSKKLLLVPLILLFSILLLSCRKPDMEGIVIRTEEKYVQIATELSLDEYEEIKHKSAEQIQDEDVLGDTYRGLINLTYDNPEKFNKGDEVKVWIDGGIRESYPAGADAKKIEVTENEDKTNDDLNESNSDSKSYENADETNDKEDKTSSENSNQNKNKSIEHHNAE